MKDDEQLLIYLYLTNHDSYWDSTSFIRDWISTAVMSGESHHL